MTVRITQAGLAHAGVIAALHERCFAEPWNDKACAEVLAMPGCLARLAVDADDTPVGFVILTATQDEAEVVTLGVPPEHRGAGVARSLMEGVLAAVLGPRCVLEVAVDNDAARGLYGALGFSEAGRRKGYYRRSDGPVDALILEKKLTRPE